MGRPRGTVAIECPHCEHQALARTSVKESVLSRFIRYVCTNEECRHVFAGQLVIVHTILPPIVANPDVQLRVSPFFKTAANDVPLPAGLLVPANDVGSRLEA